MSFWSFLTRTHGRNTSAKLGRKWSYRPTLESLEDRLVPSASALIKPPAAPEVTAVAMSATQIELTWTAVPGATGYRIDQVVGGTVKQLATLTSNTLAVYESNLSPNSTYVFEVGSSNAGGTSLSAAHSVTTKMSPPAAPVPTATAASATQIDLTWNAVSGASSYVVYEVVNGALRQIASLGSNDRSLNVTSLASATTYSFVVGATNAGGTTLSTTHSATTLTKAPPAPSFSVTMTSSTQGTLSWTRVAGATSYAVAMSANGGPAQILKVSSTTTKVNLTLTPGTTYEFDVVASNAGGNTAAPVQLIKTPPAPTSVAAPAINSEAAYLVGAPEAANFESGIDTAGEQFSNSLDNLNSYSDIGGDDGSDDDGL